MKHFIEVLHVNKVLYLAGEVHTDIPMDKIGSYVEENLQCFIAVLEVLRDFKVGTCITSTTKGFTRFPIYTVECSTYIRIFTTSFE